MNDLLGVPIEFKQTHETEDHRPGGNGQLRRFDMNDATDFLSQDEYFKLSKKSRQRLMASPSHGHFRKPHATHLHAVIEFGADGGDPLCSFIQRGAKVRFYRGYPNWSDWMRQTPGSQQPHMSVFVVGAPDAEASNGRELKQP